MQMTSIQQIQLFVQFGGFELQTFNKFESSPGLNLEFLEIQFWYDKTKRSQGLTWVKKLLRLSTTFLSSPAAFTSDKILKGDHNQIVRTRSPWADLPLNPSFQHEPGSQMLSQAVPQNKELGWHLHGPRHQHMHAQSNTCLQQILDGLAHHLHSTYVVTFLPKQSNAWSPVVHLCLVVASAYSKV